ncbi:2TM domain-containing protein [Polaribacter ponticola]|uniref:2TM domain-containing protein n=1 Tax=Polaribacter ponticola TaxID=2978475 RepID=A0ABT5S9X2_9FLAO|nr:2TM domain-containing protein [Polaribacter sp. MSW5]MDD7914281.1 2TM domain-containing protein [Polaribacter sp. MSW5]
MKLNDQNIAFKEAEKRVKRIKNFYNHLQIFVIMMLVLLLFSKSIIGFFENHVDNINSLAWIKANIWINALLWFIGLVIHGFVAFRYKIGFIDKWEKSKLEELMNKKH